MKPIVEIKAEPMTTSRLESWLKGEIPRRKLVIPFGGPIPSAKSSLGVDLDGEWFDADTDLYGPFPGLRTTRERMVDWHHDADPTGVMKGAILGREVLDEQPESDGLWADWWVNVGEKRKRLIAELEQRGQALYGSSQAVAGAVKKSDDGHIDVWPMFLDTATTSPQNTYAVVPTLKAWLDPGLSFDEVGLVAFRAALVGLDALALADNGLSGLPAAGATKAGRVLSRATEAELRRAIDILQNLMPAVAEAIAEELAA